MGIFEQRRLTFSGTTWLALAALVAALAVTPVNRALAQGAVKSVHKDWQIRCDTPPGAKSEQCALIQSVTAEDRANVGLTVIVLKTADAKSRLMRVVAPLGVLLPSGLGLKIDQADIGRAGFVRCLPNGCIAEVVMDDELLKKLRTSKTATFIIFQTPEEGIGFPMSLAGFGRRLRQAALARLPMKKPLGKLPRRRHPGMMELPVFPSAILDGFRALPDLTGMSSDAMDELRIVGRCAGRLASPNGSEGADCWPRAHRAQRRCENSSNRRRQSWRLDAVAEIEAHNLAEPGDILVLQGVDQVSNMGSIFGQHRPAARLRTRRAIVDGAVRDIDHSREIGYAMWSRSVSPITGKWRIETVAINQPVSICGIAVNPGDLVFGGRSGCLFHPARTRC